MMNIINSLNYEKHHGASIPLYVDRTAFPLPGYPDVNLNSVKSKDNVEARQQLVQAGRQFEAYFISYLLKVMRETVPQGAIANKQGAYFHSFYDQEIGMRAAESGGIGLTQMVQEYAEKYFSPLPVQPSSSRRGEPIKDSTG
jgi:peptidoglycan hydrolase FlgJ